MPNNRVRVSHSFFSMKRSIVLLLFLLSCPETSNGKWKSQEKTTERVLVRSKRRWVVTTIELEEENPGPYPVKITTLFNDRQTDNDLWFSISGHGVSEEPNGVLSIDENTGEVFMHQLIDREKYPVFHVQFNVHDKKTGQLLDNTLSFDVVIQDKNDNPPVFQRQVFYLIIPENITEGELPLSLIASDKDQENHDNSRISMRLLSQNPAQPNITVKTGNKFSKLEFTGCFDYDKISHYILHVEARDHGTPSLSSTATVDIRVTDSNTHAPVITAPKYSVEVHEGEANKEVLRIPVEDQDTPNTSASRAVFTILKGNEEGNYNIETDPRTNEGVLTVIKAKNYERTTITVLEIGVENEDPLFLCVDGKPVRPIPETYKSNSKINVTVEVIDVNDPPVFRRKIDKIYAVEEEEPKGVLFAPAVTDEDSDQASIRYELVDDPAKWMSIDQKTGNLTLIKKIDRESPYVKKNTYTVVMRAIDDGKPPATGTGTLVVHLMDTNDNAPRLSYNVTTLCVNNAESVDIIPTDADDFPFSGPFSFKLGREDQELKRLWKLHPSSGDNSSLISLTSLPYGTYFVPLTIADQQGLSAHETLAVVVCTCTEKNVCEDLGRSANLHGAAIGILLGALFLMAIVLCFCLLCECNKRKELQQYLQFDGNQTLISYNDEGAGSSCKSPTGSFKLVQEQEYNPKYAKNLNMESGVQLGNGVGKADLNNVYTMPTLGNGVGKADLNNVYTMPTSWRRNSRTSASETIWSGLSRSFSFNMEDLIDMRLSKLSKEQQDFPEYHPQKYNSEGMTDNGSLDRLSFHSTEEPDLHNLGPRFNTLNEICQEAIIEKNIKM